VHAVLLDQARPDDSAVHDQQADRAAHGAGHPAVENGQAEHRSGDGAQQHDAEKPRARDRSDGEAPTAELPRLQERRAHGAATGAARCRDTSPSSTRVGSVAVRRGPPTGIGTCVG